MPWSTPLCSSPTRGGGDEQPDVVDPQREGLRPGSRAAAAIARLSASYWPTSSPVRLEMAYFGAGPVLWAERLVRKKCWILSSRMVYGRRHQREEVVHISDSYQGTLEVAGR